MAPLRYYLPNRYRATLPVTRAPMYAVPVPASTSEDLEDLPRIPCMDRAELGTPQRTDEGYLRIPARLARTGVLNYGNRKVLVPPSVLADPRFLQSLEGKPVTLEHPPKLLDPKIVGRYRQGVVLPPVTFDGEYVNGLVQVENDTAIDSVESGKTKELSIGYITTDSEESGVDSIHGAYTHVRRTMEAGNHVALTKKGRAGRNVRLMMDSEGTEVEIEITPSTEPTLLSMLAGLLALYGLDPASYADEKAAIAALEEKTKAMKADMDAAKEAPMMLEGADAMIAKVAEDGAKPTAPPGVKMDSAKLATLEKNHANARKALQLVNTERVRLDSLAADKSMKDTVDMGLSDLRKAVVKAHNPKARMDAADDYYRAAVDMIPEPKRATGGLSELSAAAAANLKAGGARMDSADPTPKPSLSAISLKARVASTPVEE